MAPGVIEAPVGAPGRVAGTTDADRRAAAVGADLERRARRVDLEGAVGAAHELVIVAVVDDWPALQGHVRRARIQIVAHVRGVAAGLEPDALDEPHAGEFVGPGRHVPVEVEALQEADARRRLHAAFPDVRVELEAVIVEQDRVVELGDQQAAADRRGEGGQQQAVVAAREGAGHGAGGEPADAVGDQPFALERDVEIAAQSLRQMDVHAGLRKSGRSARSRAREAPPSLSSWAALRRALCACSRATARP